VDAPRLVALWHLASLDAPTVAVAWALGFAWSAHLHLAWPVLLVLALATWAIYISDRLLDARAGLGSAARAALRERHFFHWRHRRVLAPLAAAAVCSAGGMALALIPSIVFACGAVLAAASLAYFYGVHARHETARSTTSFPAGVVCKELLAALLITAGCVLPSWPRFHASAGQGSAIWLVWAPCVYLAALMWLNCWCITKWESAPDAVLQRRSRRPGTKTLAPFEAAALLALCGMLLAMLAAASSGRSAALLAAGGASALLLALLDQLRTRMTPLALRSAADLVMLTPLVFLLR
jgi:hypothetical protein